MGEGPAARSGSQQPPPEVAGGPVIDEAGRLVGMAESATGPATTVPSATIPWSLIERRLGTVHPGMNGSFVIPPNLTTSGGVELQVSPAASNQRFRSGELLLAPGSIVDLIVTPQLFSSTATIRP